MEESHKGFADKKENAASKKKSKEKNLKIIK